MALAMLDEGTLKTLAPIKDTKELVKLAGALREEPALINLLKAEKRLPMLLALMKGASADELKFAILRANAHEAGVAAEHTERLVSILRGAGVSAEVATTWGSKAFANLASNANALAELEKILPLVKSGKITGLQDWLRFNGTKGAEDVARTSGELREAARLSAENPSATVDLGGDEKAPKKPGNPNEKLPSFDLGLNQGGSTQRSVEVGSVDRPVTSGTNMIAGVTHAADKVAERNAAGIPVPGKHDATIQVSLATKVDQKASGAIEISPNGDRVRVTKRTPPDRMAMSNIFDEFTDKIAQGDPAGLLDRVNVVDAKTGALLAHYDKDGRVWKRVR
jgi:hypothetical protein